MTQIMMTGLEDRGREDGWSGFWKLLAAEEGRGWGEQPRDWAGHAPSQEAMILPET